MASTAESYRVAAREHLERADDQFSNGSFYLAHYLCGLAVECHLRAYMRRNSPEFDPRHDIALLAKNSGYYEIVSADRAPILSASVSVVNTRWRSNQRFYSERELLDYMTEIKAEFGRPGDRWKNAARTLLNASHEIINQGELKW